MSATDPQFATPPRPHAAPLRIRLDGPSHLHERAAWALEALLARIDVRDWVLVEADDDADIAWGEGPLLPCAPSAWAFEADAPPDPEQDPLATAFWWLARVEEQLAPPEAFDEHGRFRFEHSLLARKDAPLAAPVDTLAIRLGERGLNVWRAEREEGEPAWRLVLTHDIDLPRRWGVPGGVRRAARRVRDRARSGRPIAAMRSAAALLAMPYWRIARRDPWANARRIERLEARQGARSTSYLLVGGDHAEDGPRRMLDRGAGWFDATLMDAGVHGSYAASEQPALLVAERAIVETRVGHLVTDHRFHYLRHRPVTAWPLLAAAGFTSDASLGYAERPAFRAGTAHPFRAWDHSAGRPLDLVIIPLACMDASYDARYLDLRARARRVHALGALARIAELGGAASLLVHNDRIGAVDDDGWTRLYRSILRAVRASGGAGCTAAEAAEAYRRRLPPHRTAAPPSP